ncbi:MAG: biopolymer transporter ExbD [Ferrovum sp.]|nr:biopolymer transporter ExbD [Ferrovum sp.]NDU86822.1 biopolymer transporter ExbD [Ferrovum sp.]
MNFRRGWRVEEPDINLLPMIDVLLVILIFLMISSHFGRERGIDLQLPVGGALRSPATGSPLEIDLDAHGELRINGQSKGMDPGSVQFRALLTSQRLSGADRQSVIIGADARVPHGQVMALMEALRSTGYHHLVMRTRSGQP